ncbi:MAG: tetratricopeptide repeat protein [Myxococcales bacterium]|nr:tetratricopeptide repeat protein [Myxococcales bacterium]
MARKHPKDETTADLMIGEFESAADRIADWVGAHAALVAGAVVVCLVAAAAYGGWSSWSNRRQLSASNALDTVESAYWTAMGAAPGAFELPELANPDTAKQINAQYAERFRTVQEEHSGTVAGALAGLQRGDLVAAGGDPTVAIEIWRTTVAATSRNSSVRAILLERIAEAQEASGQWLAAARTHEQAGEISAFPLRYWSLADAARCYAAGGEPERALALFERVEAAPTGLRLPVHMRMQLRELRAAAAS